MSPLPSRSHTDPYPPCQGPTLHCVDPQEQLKPISATRPSSAILPVLTTNLQFKLFFALYSLKPACFPLGSKSGLYLLVCVRNVLVVCLTGGDGGGRLAAQRRPAGCLSGCSQGALADRHLFLQAAVQPQSCRCRGLILFIWLLRKR